MTLLSESILNSYFKNIPVNLNVSLFLSTVLLMVAMYELERIVVVIVLLMVAMYEFQSIVVATVLLMVAMYNFQGIVVALEGS